MTPNVMAVSSKDRSADTTTTAAADATSPVVTGLMPACTSRRHGASRNRCQALTVAMVSSDDGPTRHKVDSTAPAIPATRNPISADIIRFGPGAAWARANSEVKSAAVIQ